MVVVVTTLAQIAASFQSPEELCFQAAIAMGEVATAILPCNNHPKGGSHNRHWHVQHVTHLGSNLLPVPSISNEHLGFGAPTVLIQWQLASGNTDAKCVAPLVHHNSNQNSARQRLSLCCRLREEKHKTQLTPAPSRKGP